MVFRRRGAIRNLLVARASRKKGATANSARAKPIDDDDDFLEGSPRPFVHPKPTHPSPTTTTTTTTTTPSLRQRLLQQRHCRRAAVHGVHQGLVLHGRLGDADGVRHRPDDADDADVV
jgi:hypothetical protein